MSGTGLVWDIVDACRRSHPNPATSEGKHEKRHTAQALSQGAWAVLRPSGLFQQLGSGATCQDQPDKMPRFTQRRKRAVLLIPPPGTGRSFAVPRQYPFGLVFGAW